MGEGVPTIWRFDAELGAIFSMFGTLADSLVAEECAEAGARLEIFFSMFYYSVVVDNNLVDKK